MFCRMSLDFLPFGRSYTSTPPVRLHGVVLSEKAQGWLHIFYLCPGYSTLRYVLLEEILVAIFRYIYF